jgi:hypothetical protein
MGFSLLHAAIALEKPELVARILHLGADPRNVKGEVGSALGFATSMAEHRKENLEREKKREKERDEQVKEGKPEHDALSKEKRRAAIEQLENHANKMQEIVQRIQNFLNPPQMPKLAFSASFATRTERPTSPLQLPPKEDVPTGGPSSSETLKQAINEDSPSGGNIMSAFCKSILSNRSANGWSDESTVASTFYDTIGKDREAFVSARRDAFAKGLVERGRKDLQARNNPIVVCTRPSPNRSKESFLRLTTSGSALAQEGSNCTKTTRTTAIQAPLNSNNNNNNHASELLPPQVGKRPADAIGNIQPPTKRRATPILINRLEAVKSTAAATVAEKVHTVELRKWKREPSPEHVLGGVSQMLLSGHQENGRQKEPAGPIGHLLESTWSSTGEWRRNCEVASTFYKKAGHGDKEVFKQLRKQCLYRKFIKWGRINLLAPGQPIEETIRGQNDGYSLDSFLVLTGEGLNFLNSHGFNSSEELIFRDSLPTSTSPAQDDLSQQRAFDNGGPEMRSHDDRNIPRNEDRPPRRASAETRNTGGPEMRSLDDRNVSRNEDRPPRRPSAETRNHRRDSSSLESTTYDDNGRPRSFERHQYGHRDPHHRSQSDSRYDHVHRGHWDSRRDGRYGEVEERSSGRYFEQSSTDEPLPDIRGGRFWCATERVCNNAPHCHCYRPHLCPPLGRTINPVLAGRLNLNEVMFCEKGGRDRPWITAAYFDRRSRIYFHSQGGSTSRRSGQGLYWYPSKTLATTALEQVIGSFFETYQPPPPPVFLR